MDFINDFNSVSNSGIDMAHNFISNVCSYFSDAFVGMKLEDESIRTAVHDACRFIHIDDLPIKYTENTGIFTNNPETLCDDILGIGRQQLIDLGIDNEKALSLVCTHEIGHCMLQQLSAENVVTGWNEELSCDAFMGWRAAIENIDTSDVENSIKDKPGTSTHPNGELRLRYIEIGKEIGEDLKNHDIPVTAENIMERLVDHLNKDATLITSQEGLCGKDSENSTFKGYDSEKAKQEWSDWHTKQAEQAARNGDACKAKEELKTAESYRNSMKSFVDGSMIGKIHGGTFGNATGDYVDDSHSDGNFKGMWIDDREWHRKEAEHAKSDAEWHHKEAAAAIKRGDMSSYNSHVASEKSANQKYKDELDSASRCTK